MDDKSDSVHTGSIPALVGNNELLRGNEIPG
jgi:hypothetical protein